MAAAIPSTEPTRLTAGDTWEWTKSLADYLPADGWALSYVVTGPSTIRFNASESGTGYVVTVAAATTKTLPAGSYRWASYVTSGSTRKQVGEGLLEVVANFETIAVGGSTASFAVRNLTVVEAAIEGRLPTSLEEYQIAGKVVKHMPIMELMNLRARLRQEVAREQHGGRLASLEVAFVAPR